MKVWAVVLATWFCLNITFGSSATVSPLLANDDHLNSSLAADPIIFTTQGATASSYSTFLQSIRDAVKSGSTSHDIPVLRSSVAAAQQYLVVQLSNGAKQVNIGLNVINLYVVAYQVGANSYFFSDAPATAMTYLFKNTKQTKLKFGGRYDDLANKEANRVTTQLGILALSDDIYTLNKETKPEK